MPVVVDDTCIACGSCHQACPAGAVVPGDSYRIDPVACTGCASCIEVCPTSSIFEPRPAQINA